MLSSKYAVSIQCWFILPEYMKNKSNLDMSPVYVHTNTPNILATQ